MPNPIDMPTADVDMLIDNDYYWNFYPITSGSNSSEIHKDNNRYVVTQNIDDITGDTEYREKLLDIATKDDYTSLLDDPNTSYLKIELSAGGRSTRTNFHDDGLTGGFFVQDNKYYEIVGQEGGHIIDVSIKDITQTSTLDPNKNADYVLTNEFGWKVVEWYMANTRRRFLEGTIIAINTALNSIKIEVAGENIPTIYEDSYIYLGARASISFFRRYTEQYDHDISSNPRKLYSKFKGWYTYNSTNNYSVSNIAISPTRVGGESYQAIIQFNEDIDGFTIGDNVYTIFDKTPYSKQGSFNGAYLVEVNDINRGRDDVNVDICLDGFWLSPKFNVAIPDGTRLGLCGGRYWGLGENAPDNENAIIFMRSPEGVLGIASMYHHITNEDFILYYDTESMNVSIRKGSTMFTEYPSKYEVSIGESSVSSSAVLVSENTTVPLDTSKDRTKLLTMSIPDENKVMLFSVGSIDEYYGATICGEGEMDLIGLERSGIPQTADLYKYNDKNVSPVYEYMRGKYANTNVREVPLSVETDKGPIIISNPDVGVSISSVKVHYIKENQTINNASLFDIYEMDDGEIMIFMGRRFRGFTVQNPDDPVTEVSNSGSTAWPERNGIFVIGSKDSGISWGTPNLSRKDFKGDNQFGLLILDNVNFCCSIYNKLFNSVIMFFSSLVDDNVYLGAFIVDLSSLNYKSLKCIPEGDTQEFLWRPPALDDPTYNPNPVVDNFTFSSSDGLSDILINVASESSGLDPKVVVSGVTDFGVVSATLLNDGVIILFYDTLDGIKILFSISSGLEWSNSEIILARNSQGAMYEGGLLFYITPSGIEAKIVPESLLNDATKAIAGTDESFIESIQSAFDNAIRTSLNTGPVQIQELTGHEDDTGVFHIYYYDDDGRLCSAEGTDETWSISKNF